jgi:hypothetical protein
MTTPGHHGGEIMAKAPAKAAKAPTANELVQLIDTYGQLSGAIKRLEADLEPIKERLKKYVDGRAEGQHFFVNVSSSETTTIDTKALRAEMGDKWCRKFERTGKRSTMTWGSLSEKETDADAIIERLSKL